MVKTEYLKDEKYSLKGMGDRLLEGFFQSPNQGDYSFIPTLYSPLAVIHTLDGEKKGPEIIIEIFKKWKIAFPDFHMEPLFLSQESDVLVAHWRVKGTFTNQIREIQPNGKKITLHGLTCFRCLNNQIIEHWARVDYKPLTL